MAHISTSSSLSLRMRAGRPGRDAHRGRSAHRLDPVEKAHRQGATGDEVDLLDLLVVMARALLKIGVGRNPDECDSDLVAPQSVG